MKARLLFPILVLLVPLAVDAGSVKLKEWAGSPQSYFMTRAERDQWAAVKTDAEAEQFVKGFLAARKPDFAAEVDKRAQVADKYLTVGRTPGSRTLRGKVIIMLGPPSGFDVKVRTATGAGSSSAGGYLNAAGGASPGGGSGPSPADVADATRQAEMGSKQIREFTITYSGDKLPVRRAETLTVAVDVNAASGQESLALKGQESELNELFEAAANTWLVKKAP